MNTVTPITQRQNRLDALCEALVHAKAKEDDAKKVRVAIEDEILAIVGAKDEGSLTVNTDHFKVTTTGRITRTLDAKKVDNLSLPAPLLARLFTWQPKLNLREARYVENNEPDHWKVLATAITTKPGKASVKVEATPDAAA